MALTQFAIVKAVANGKPLKLSDGGGLHLKSEIRSRMAEQAPFGVWTPTDFMDLGSRDAVDQALSRMTAAGDIRRITRGLYDMPRLNTLTDRPTKWRTRWKGNSNAQCYAEKIQTPSSRRTSAI